MEEETKKETFPEWIQNHPKTVFTIRLILWAVFAAGLPFAFIAWRYGIFTTASKIELTGWGIIGIIILVVFGITLASYLYKGMKQGLLKQCIHGFVTIVLPLGIVMLIVTAIKDNITLFQQALGCVIICELVGIPLNPFPDWLEKRRIEQGREEAERLSDVFWDSFFKRKDKDD